METYVLNLTNSVDQFIADTESSFTILPNLGSFMYQ